MIVYRILDELIVKFSSSAMVYVVIPFSFGFNFDEDL